MSQNEMAVSDAAPDPVMINLAVQAFAQPTFVCDRIMPVVTLSRDAYKYPKFDSSHAVDDVSIDRAIGGNANIVTFNRTYQNGSTSRKALKAMLPREIPAQSPNPQSIENQRVLTVANRIKIGIEKKVRDKLLALTTAGSPSVKWDASSGVTIKKNIDAYKKLFRIQSGGIDANVLLTPYDVAVVMSNDSDVLARDKRTDDSQLTSGLILPPMLFGLQTVIAGALSKATSAADFANIWSTDDIWLLYVDPTTSANGGDVQTFGAQFRAPTRGLPMWAAKWPASPDANSDWYGEEVNQDENFICEECAMRVDNVLT